MKRTGIIEYLKSQKGQQKLIIGAFILIPLLLLFTFTYLPFGEMVGFSFYDMKYIGQRTFVGLRNYRDVFTRDDIFGALSISLYYMGGSIVQLVFALLLATLLSFRTKGLNNVMLVGTSLWRYLGQNMVLFIGAIMSVDPTLYEAAEIDGANRFQQFRHIILPSIKTIITLNVILSITGSLSAFEPPFVTTKGGNGTGTYFIIMDRIAHTSQKVGLASAMAVFLLCIIFVVTILQKLFFKYIFRNAGTESAAGGDVL